MKRNWLWFILCSFWTAHSGYWAGLSLERTFSPSICLGVLTLSTMLSFGFLIAFIDSSEINKTAQEIK